MTQPAATLRYDVVDVFTDRPFAGNPLAVVHDAGALSTGQLQAIAREFNLSETAFPLPPSAAGADYHVRIFTPAAELAFAGHPSVGTAWVLARDKAIGYGEVVQECGAGLLPLVVDAEGARLTGGTPVVRGDLDPGPLLAAVGLEPDDLDGAAPAGMAAAGADFAFLAVHDTAVSRARPDQAAIGSLDVRQGFVLFSFDRQRRRAHVRMFTPALGVPEDPATGSAAVALGVFLVWRGLLTGDGESAFVIHQGAEIGRPSTLDCTAVAAAGAAVRTTVRGGVVPVASGEIVIPSPG
ncbi:MAG TPA: PhzF family phenazine biosynthesis protein [Pseudonocardiaceae bacterium]|nr:PhzF family phenazine biosynthesis protein [Pseudonocardiaceae bacterium]